MGGTSAGGWLKVTLLTLVAVIALIGATVLYALFNPASLVPIASYLTESLLGRTLTVNGDVALEVSLQPRVTVRDATFGNAGWSDQPYMVTAEYAMVQIDLVDLLSNRVHILDLDARGAALYLEDRVDGEPNWTFFEDEEESDPPWTFMIQGLELTDCEIFASLGELEPVHLVIPTLVESSDENEHLHLVGEGTLNEDRWWLKGRIGPLEELLVAGRIELDLAMVLDDVEIAAAGTIGNLETLAALDLSLSARGPDADPLGELFRSPEAFQDEVALTATIAPEDGGHRLSVAGQVSSFELAAEGTVLDLDNLDGWDLVVDIAGPDAGIFGKALQISGFPDGPFTVSGNLHMHGGDFDLTDVDIVTEDAELKLTADFVQFPHPEGAFATLQLTGPDISQFGQLLRIPSLPVAPFALNLTLDRTGDEMDATLTVGTHTLRTEGIIGRAPDYLGTRLATELQGGDIAQILRLAGIEDALTGAYQSSALVTIDESGLQATDVVGSHGPFRIKGEAHLPDFEHLASFSASARLSISDLMAAGDVFGVADLPEEAMEVEAGIQSVDGSYQLTAGRIDFRNLSATAQGRLGDLTGLVGLDLDITIRGPDIGELIDDAIVEDESDRIAFTFGGRLRGQEGAIELIGFDLLGQGGGFTLDGRLALTDRFTGSSFTITGRGRNLANLVPRMPNYLPPAEPWEIAARVNFPDPSHLKMEQGSVRVGSVTLMVSGLLDAEDQSGTDLSLNLEAASLIDIGQIGDAALPDIPVKLALKLDGTTDTINVTKLDAEWGESNLNATGSVALGEKPVIVLKGSSETMILVDLQKALFGEQNDIEPEDDLDRVFADTPIPMDDFLAFDADVDIQVDKFRGARSSLDDVTLKLKVKDGAFLVERAAYRDNRGFFDMTAVLRPEGERAHLDFQLIGKDADFGVLTSPDQAPETIPRYTLQVDITGIGATVAELAGSLNGSILVSSDGGRIDNALLDAFTGDFLSNVLDVLNPFANNEPFTPMECMVVNAVIEDGILNLEPGFVMRTNQVNMFVFGKVNLKTERLDLSLATQARRGIGISAASITNPYFKVGGTLAAPALQLDPTSAAVAASVATATAGLSIVIRGVWDRLLGQQNPCPKFLEYNRSEG